MPSPKVLHIVPQLFGSAGIYGGGERYATELSAAMSERTATRLVGFGAAAERSHRGGLDIFTLRNQLPGARFEPSPASLGLLRHLRWADVIHCHQIHTMATSVALLYARATGKPIFVTDHGGGGVCLQRYFDLDSWFSGRLWVSRFSQGANPGLPGDQIIWGGVDTERFRPGPAGQRSAEILFVGRLLPIKGVHLLLEAVDAATPVALLGPAYDVAYYRHLQQLAQGKQVRFLPPTDGVELVRAYQRALCVVLPGVETLGLTLLEAMSCGTPAICTEHSGMPELMQDGVNGMVIPAGTETTPTALRDKIAWLRRQPQAARAMGQAARQRVLEGFTWQHVVGRCLAAYTAAWPGARAVESAPKSAVPPH